MAGETGSPLTISGACSCAAVGVAAEKTGAGAAAGVTAAPPELTADADAGVELPVAADEMPRGGAVRLCVCR